MIGNQVKNFAELELGVPRGTLDKVPGTLLFEPGYFRTMAIGGSVKMPAEAGFDDFPSPVPA